MVPQTAFCRDLQPALGRMGFWRHVYGVDFNITKPKIDHIGLTGTILVQPQSGEQLYRVRSSGLKVVWVCECNTVMQGSQNS